MAPHHQPPEEIEKAWRYATKILLGEELENIQSYEWYLTRYYIPPRVVESREGPVALPERYSKRARVVPKVEPFDINEIKDIDSLFEKARELFYVVGNRVLGQSAKVALSNAVMDSFAVYQSNTVTKSKYVAYSSYAKEVSYSFGCHDLAWSTLTINSWGIGGGRRNSRTFESFYILGGVSDVYYSHNVQGCRECFFAFFQRGKQYVVGNLQLSREKYMGLKAALLEQIVDELKAKKLTSLVELVLEARREVEPEEVSLQEQPPEQLEKGYGSLTKALFGRARSLQEDGPFLSKNLPFYDLAKIRMGTQEDIVGGVGYYFYKHPREKVLRALVPQGMVGEMGSLSEGEPPTTLEELKRTVEPLLRLNFSVGSECQGNVESTICFLSSNIYRVVMPVRASNAAYSFWPRESSHVFGSSVIFDSSSVVRSYDSESVTRVFEVDSSKKVKDAFYCYGCDEVSKGLFSTAVTGKSYVILNKPVPSTEWERVAAYLKDYLAEEPYPPRIFELW